MVIEMARYTVKIPCEVCIDVDAPDPERARGYALIVYQNERAVFNHVGTDWQGVEVMQYFPGYDGFPAYQMWEQSDLEGAYREHARRGLIL
ncbi:MAG: hypothetical protein Q4P84_08635 [Elusimicrobiales bacterium]|nr:hypothetical protein [Elusimicrobiales bacterium]